MCHFSKLPKKLPNIWDIFVRKFVVRTFQSGHTVSSTVSLRLYTWTGFQCFIPPFVMLSTKSIFSALYKWFNFDIIEK